MSSAHLWIFSQDNATAAVVVALLSTCCYAISALIQEREASRQDADGLISLLTKLISRLRWWLSVATTLLAAGLHIGALALGPLSLVQPIGVLSLVLALALGARLAGQIISRQEWMGAAAVVVGLGATLTILPHSAPHSPISVRLLLVVAAGLALLVGLLLGLARRLPRRSGAVLTATAAATCSGLASAMTRVAVTGSAPFAFAALVAVCGAVAGLGLSQPAYRTGGLGAPLATLNLVDPVVSVLIGLTILAEPLAITPTRISVGAVGFAVTWAGIWALSRPNPSAASAVSRT
jgi:drug/metabolite transporter (DMT)-like permease